MKTKHGFTLVEMMTVIVIIGILAGITMKLMVYVNHKMGKARAAGDIEQIKHALVAYYAVYGIFPPVGRMDWEKENPKAPPPKNPPPKDSGLYDGLTTYLAGDDPNNDRWSHFIQGMLATDWIPRGDEDSAQGGVRNWTNDTVTIKDPWGNDYIYASYDPYQGYHLFSSGPDGKTNTADDVGLKWTE